MSVITVREEIPRFYVSRWTGENLEEFQSLFRNYHTVMVDEQNALLIIDHPTGEGTSDFPDVLWVADPYDWIFTTEPLSPPTMPDTTPEPPVAIILKIIRGYEWESAPAGYEVVPE